MVKTYECFSDFGRFLAAKNKANSKPIVGYGRMSDAGGQISVFSLPSSVIMWKKAC